MNLFRLNGIREIDFDLDESSIQELSRRWRLHLSEKISEYPQQRFSGKGIVICGGGIEYFTCAWVVIKYLQSKNCNLPIELWYVGAELNKGCIDEMEQLGIQCKNLADYGDSYIDMRGYTIKPLSIINSAFEEVLFIDADNICLDNPENLFYSKEYEETGAVFWPDFWQTAPDNPIWNIMGVEYLEAPEQESGQLLIHKKKCWKALNLCLYLNLNHLYYHKLLLGDKDTFRFSWMAIKQPFYMVHKQPDTGGYMDEEGNFRGFSMLQYNITGERPIFLHRNLIKWDKTKTDNRLWRKAKRFITSADEREIFIGYSPEEEHNFVDFVKGYEMYDFEDKFGDIENICFQYLDDLRNRDFYKVFLAEAASQDLK